MTEVSHCHWNERVLKSLQSLKKVCCCLIKPKPVYATWCNHSSMPWCRNQMTENSRLYNDPIVHDYTPHFCPLPKLTNWFKIPAPGPGFINKLRQELVSFAIRDKDTTRLGRPLVSVPTNVWVGESMPTDLTWSRCVSSKYAGQFVLHKNHTHD